MVEEWEEYLRKELTNNLLNVVYYPKFEDSKVPMSKAQYIELVIHHTKYLRNK